MLLYISLFSKLFLLIFATLNVVFQRPRVQVLPLGAFTFYLGTRSKFLHEGTAAYQREEQPDFRSISWSGETFFVSIHSVIRAFYLLPSFCFCSSTHFSFLYSPVYCPSFNFYPSLVPSFFCVFILRRGIANTKDTWNIVSSPSQLENIR